MKEMFLKKIQLVSNKAVDLPWDDRDFYANWIAQTYYYSTHSIKLIHLAAAMTDNKDFYKRCLEHIKEETGHPEIAISDLKQMGKNIEEYPELTITKLFYEVQYSRIYNNPYLFFGYAMSLEMLAAKVLPLIINKMEKTHGKSAVKFMSLHCEADKNHVEEALSQIQKFPEHILQMIYKNFNESLNIYNQMLFAIYSESLASNIKPKYELSS